MTLWLLATHTSEHDERIALYTAVGAVMVALVGIVGIWIQVRANQRVTRDEHEQTRGAVDKVYQHVNNLEESEAVPENGEAVNRLPTLGTVLRAVERKVEALDGKVAEQGEEVRDGFRRNDETHKLIIGTVGAQGETIHDHGRRIDQIRSDITRLHPED